MTLASASGSVLLSHFETVYVRPVIGSTHAQLSTCNAHVCLLTGNRDIKKGDTANSATRGQCSHSTGSTLPDSPPSTPGLSADRGRLLACRVTTGAPSGVFAIFRQTIEGKRLSLPGIVESAEERRHTHLDLGCLQCERHQGLRVTEFLSRSCRVLLYFSLHLLPHPRTITVGFTDVVAEEKRELWFGLRLV